MPPRAAKKQDGLHEFSMRLSNARDRELSLILEPWGDIVAIQPDDEVLVVFLGPVPTSDIPEIEVTDDSMTVYGWTGSYASIFRNGEEIVAGMPDDYRVVANVPQARGLSPKP
jgi:hypothetical protein